MKTARIVLLVLGLVVIAILVYLVWQLRTGELEYPGWSEIRLGDTRGRVVELMGPPVDEGREFPIPARPGYEKMRAEAGQSGATVWLVYRAGLGVVYAVGLDAAGRVVFTGRGEE